MSITLPSCLFGDGCLLRLTDDLHDLKYSHHKSFLPVCVEDPRCEKYILARNYITNGGERTKEVKMAQNHVAMCYHSPIYSQPKVNKMLIDDRRESIGRHRQRSISVHSGSSEPPFKDKITVDLTNIKKESTDLPSGNTEIGDSAKSSPVKINIPKLKLASKSLPSSPVSKSDFLDTPNILNTPSNMPTSSSKVIRTPKHKSRNVYLDEKFASAQAKIDLININIKDIQEDIEKLKSIVKNLDQTQKEMRESINVLRDQLIKACLDD